MSDKKRAGVGPYRRDPAIVPMLYGEGFGWYYAPDGKRYYGCGKITEVGDCHDSRYIYCHARPKFDRDSGIYAFFDPATGESMPKNCLPGSLNPEYCRIWYLLHDRCLPVFNGAPEVGEHSPGFYRMPTGTFYKGIGRTVSPKRAGVTWLSIVEPIPGETEGCYQFFGEDKEDDMPEWAFPRGPYPGFDKTRKETERLPDEQVSSSFGYPGISYMPNLGDEAIGSYVAPDGQWYVGKGKIVALGWNPFALGCNSYIYVEPIPSKHGGEYDFAFLYTNERMANFADSPRPGEGQLPSQEKETGGSMPDWPPWNRWRDFPRIERIPALGEEYPGRYLPPTAPRREFYLGVGKVVKTGTTEQGRIFVQVEPIEGKEDGNYQFFDPFTGKDMPEVYLPWAPGNRIRLRSKKDKEDVETRLWFFTRELTSATADVADSTCESNDTSTLGSFSMSDSE